MGQKVNPRGLRLSIASMWQSSWYSKNCYAKKVHEDIKIRSLIFNSLKHAGINKVLIERAINKVTVSIHSYKPGVVIGKKGADINKIKGNISKITSSEIFINIKEVRKVETKPLLIARNIADQLEKRVSFKKAVKRAIACSMKMGVMGVKISVSGRLGGAEIARTEWYKEGKVPLHTLRAKIDYDLAEARTTYGVIGVKVWICTSKE